MSKKKYAHIALATVAAVNVVAPVATTVSNADFYSNETINPETIKNEAINVESNNRSSSIDNLSERERFNRFYGINRNNSESDQERFNNFYGINKNSQKNQDEEKPGENPYEKELLQKFKSGEYRTEWVKGVEGPKLEDFTWFKDDTHEYMTASHRYGKNWYDVNKRFDGIDDKLCSAAVSANMIHWWLNMNKDKVEKYLKVDPMNGVAITDGEGAYIPETKEYKKRFDLRELIQDGFDTNKHKSSIFDLYRLYFPHGCVWAHSTSALFFNGYGGNTKREINVDTWKKYRNAKEHKVQDKRGGFFADLLEDKQIYSGTWIRSYDTFNYMIKDAMRSGKSLGIAYNSAYRTAHVINVWGVDLDKNDNIVAIYVSDSDDGGTKYKDKNSGEIEVVGLKRYRIQNKYDMPMINNVYREDRKGTNIVDIQTLSLATEDWDNYLREYGEKIRRAESQIQPRALRSSFISKRVDIANPSTGKKRIPKISRSLFNRYFKLR